MLLCIVTVFLYNATAKATATVQKMMLLCTVVTFCIPRYTNNFIALRNCIFTMQQAFRNTAKDDAVYCNCVPQHCITKLYDLQCNSNSNIAKDDAVYYRNILYSMISKQFHFIVLNDRTLQRIIFLSIP